MHDDFTPSMHWMWRLRPLGYLLCSALLILNRLGLRRRIFQRDLREFDAQARRLIAAGKEKEMVRQYSSFSVDLKYNPLANYLQSIYQALRPLPYFECNNVPVLLLLSSQSHYSKQGAEPRFIRQFSNHRIQGIECNHWPITERPDEVRRAIESWLSEL
jgi:pimeloyl-ACP methyl ester carboxylesterase